MTIVCQAVYLTMCNAIKKDQINTGITSATIDNVKHPLYHLSFLQAVYKRHKNEQFMPKQRGA